MMARAEIWCDMPSLSERETRTVAKYGVSIRMLRASWRGHVTSALYHYARVRAIVHVRRNPAYSPARVVLQTGLPGAIDIPWTALESAWIGMVAQICMLDAAARGRFRRVSQLDLTTPKRTR